MSIRPEVLVLGVAGEAGSGKDTVCDYLVAQYGFQKIAFATPLKKIVADVFPKFPEEHLYGASPLRNVPQSAYPLSGTCPNCSREMYFEDLQFWICRCGFKHGPSLTPRLALQTLGTEWGRRLYENVWVDYAFAQIEKMDGKRFCISDVRFPNEVRGIASNGGECFRIRRPKKVEPPARNPSMLQVFRSLFGAKEMKHASETSLDLLPEEAFSASIRNDSTIPDLFTRVDEAIGRCL
jgi:hypothetical protein